MAKSEKRLQLEATMKKLNKNAKEKIFDFADKSPDKEVIPFGVKELDDFFGGGIPRRKYTVDFGGEDTGKSTRALHLTANAQKLGLNVVYLDMERKFDRVRAESLGVNVDELAISQIIKTADQAMDAIRVFAEDKSVDLVIVDSIHGMSPRAEQETKKGKQRSIEEDEIAVLARKLGKFFRVTSADVFKANMAVYMIGQVRTNIGGFFAFADLSGGNALKHWMSLCTYSRKGQKANAPIEKVKETFFDPDGKEHFRTNKVPVGFECVLKMFKSHISDSARDGEDISLPFYYKTGFLTEIDGLHTKGVNGLHAKEVIFDDVQPTNVEEIKKDIKEVKTDSDFEGDGKDYVPNESVLDDTLEVGEEGNAPIEPEPTEPQDCPKEIPVSKLFNKLRKEDTTITEANPKPKKKGRGRKKLLKNLKEEEFNSLKDGGMLWELYPEAPEFFKDIERKK